MDARPPQSSEPTSSASEFLGWTNLIYLALLPAVATFGLVYRHGSPDLGLGDASRAVIGVVGFTAVAVQMAVLVTYRRFPSSPWIALVVLADGPLLALASSRGSLFEFAIRAFLIDNLAVTLSIAAVAMRKLGPRNWWVPVAMMLTMVGGILLLFWPYLAHDLSRSWRSLAPLGVGAAWSLVVDYRLVSKDEAVRKGDSGAVIAFLLAPSFLWLVAYGVGIALHHA